MVGPASAGSTSQLQVSKPKSAKARRTVPDVSTPDQYFDVFYVSHIVFLWFLFIHRQQKENLGNFGSGGGTRTPDTRIMIPLFSLCCTYFIQVICLELNREKALIYLMISTICVSFCALRHIGGQKGLEKAPIEVETTSALDFTDRFETEASAD